MNQQEYEQQFEGFISDKNKMLKAEKAFEIALDIRKFEIELYWKRATYFWAFIGAALAGYALIYKAPSDTDNSWLLVVFSSLGFLFSVAWYLVNRGSKFWQNNWERHVDILEELVIGPLYKTIAHDAADNKNLLTASGQYSVSKINQILSFFISLFWGMLLLKSLLPISCSLEPDGFKIGISVGVIIAIICLFKFGKSKNNETKIKLSERKLVVEP